VAAGKAELDFRAAEAEAQQRRIANDWSGMVVALRKALQAKPGDPQTLFNLASAQMRDGDLQGAESILKQILAAPLAPSESRFRIFAHYQLGRVYDLAGRRGEALTEYDAVLALPDDHGAHALALERKASPATRAQLD
jgi:tetratricopeptide (TPR) repeat protein